MAQNNSKQNVMGSGMDFAIFIHETKNMNLNRDPMFRRDNMWVEKNIMIICGWKIIAG